MKPAIGVLMLNTQFPRPVGDIGNPASFDYSVLYEVVEPARAGNVVTQDPRPLLAAFIQAAERLIERGAVAISTSCGFLFSMQHALQAALPVPVLASSLLQIEPLLISTPPAKRVGVLTISAASLKLPFDRTVVWGMPEDSQFYQTIMEDRDSWDQCVVANEVVEAVTAFRRAHPELGALVLECTNLGPYAPAIRRATGLATYSVIDLLNSFYAGLDR